MKRIPIRELRNQASRVVRRARAGERLIITIDGIAMAEIGPLSAKPLAPSLEELIATGDVIAPRNRTAPPPPKPQRAPSGMSSADVLARLRER